MRRRDRRVQQGCEVDPQGRSEERAEHQVAKGRYADLRARRDYALGDGLDDIPAREKRAGSLANRGYQHGRRDGQNLAATSGTHIRSEEHTSELQSLMRISYAVFSLTPNINIISQTL